MIDFSPIVQPVLALTGAVITGLGAIYVPRFIAAFETRTGVALTEQQRQTVLGAAKTAAGVLETALDKGAVSIEHINIGNQAVQTQAQAAIDAVPRAAASLGLTVDDVARMIVGAVDTSAHGLIVAEVPTPKQGEPK